MHALALDAYRDAIALDTPWDAPPPAPEHSLSDLARHLVTRLRDEGGHAMRGFAASLQGSPALALPSLRSLLTVRPPGPLPADLQKGLDTLLQGLRALHPETDADRLPSVADQWPDTRLAGADAISLWRGDITTLRADAIVNAANDQLLGCFQPQHACIDNAIHWQAGPRLRQDCELVMRRQGFAEPTGTAKVTRGYNLPARFVVHTVGPIVRDRAPSAHDEARLRDAYRSCLDVAAALPSIETLAFCAISTGVFGFPKAPAARIALSTVSEWLRTDPDRFRRVVFNVFSPEDEAIYRAAVPSH